MSVIHSIGWSLWQFRKYSSTTGDKTFPQANVYCLYWVLPLWLWAKQMTKFLVRLQCMQLCMQLYIWSGSNVCSYNGKLHYNIACTLALVIIPFARHKFTFTINVYAVGIIINVFHNREMLKFRLISTPIYRERITYYSRTTRKTFELSSSFSYALAHCY